MRKNFKLIISMLSLVLCLSAVAFGQEQVGNIEGTVKDAQGGVVPNVAVTVRNSEAAGGSSGFSRTITTDSNGFFRLVQIPPGAYVVTTAATSGFGVATYENVNVVLGKTTQLEIEVKPGSAAATVDVGATDTPVDTTGSEVATSLTAQKIEMLPKGVDFTTALKAVPGTRPDTVAGGFTVDGATNAENTFVINGQEVTNYNHAGINRNNQIPFQLVQELQVKSSGFDAEYGGATGGVINVVTKGGSDDWHGEFGVQFRTSRLDGSPRPRLLRFTSDGSAEYFSEPKAAYNHFFPTANFSGPLIKNRMWFFGSWSPQIFDQTTTTTFYTNAPAATRVVTGVDTYHQTQTFAYGFARIDAQPFSKLRMTATYLWNPDIRKGVLPYTTAQFGAQEQPVNFGGTIGTLSSHDFRARQGGRNNANNITFQTVYTPTERLIASFRYNRGFLNEKGNNYFIPTGNQWSCTQGSNTIAGACAPGFVSPSTTRTVKDVSVRTSWEGDLTGIFNALGRHQVKGGYQHSSIFNDLNAAFSEIVFLCYANATLNCRINNTPFQWQTPSTVVPNPAAIGAAALQRFGSLGKGSNLNQAIYVQDKWQPTRRLTINFGVRIEKEDIPSFNQYPATFAFGWGDKVAPRIGAAYDLTGDGRTKIWGSYGRFFDRLKFHMAQGAFGGNFYRVDFADILPTSGDFHNFNTASIVGNYTDPIGGACPNTGFIGSGLSRCQSDYRIASNVPGVNIIDAGAIDPNLNPYQQREFTFGVEHSIGRHYVLRGRYTDKKLVDAIEDAGVATPGGEVYITGNPGKGLHAQFLRDNGYTFTPATPERSYRAIEVVLDKRLSDHYYFNLNYTYSRLVGNYSGLSNTDELTCRATSEYNGCARSDPGVNRAFDLPFMGYTAEGHSDSGRLATDRPNVFNAYGAYLIDWGTKTNSTEISAFQTFQQGSPLTTLWSFDGSTTIAYHRGDLGRMPMFTQTDLNISHRYKFGRDGRFTLVGDFNVLNLWDQKKPVTYQTTKTVAGITLITTESGFGENSGAPNCTGPTQCAVPATQFPGIYSVTVNPLWVGPNMGQPHYITQTLQAPLINAYNAGQLLSSLNAYFTAVPSRTISTYNKPNRFQDVRQVRFGIRLLF